MKKRKGFTLVELLVVIAIIALLVAILLPALSRAKEQARSTVCVAHIKGLILAQYTYATDSQGKFPPHYTQFPSWVKEDAALPRTLWGENVRDILDDDIPGEMTICPHYAGRAGDPVLAAPDNYWPDGSEQWGAWNTDAPHVYLSYMWFTNWTGWGPIRLNSTLEFARGEAPWPSEQDEGTASAAMIAHRAGADIDNWDLGTLKPDSIPTKGHGAMEGGGRYENPVGYGDGHVEMNSGSDIKPRARIGFWADSAIIY